MDFIRLLFMVSLAIPVVGIFLQNYSRFVSTREDFSKDVIDYTASLGTKLGTIGLLVSAVIFVAWMLQVGYLMHPVVIATIAGVLVLLVMVALNKNSYVTTGVLVVVALLISGVRELIRFDLMTALGYNIYDYPVNLEIPSITMFLLTFLIMGGIGVAYILTMSWKVGKSTEVFDGSKDKAVNKLGNYTLAIMSLWMVTFFGWGMTILFKNIL
jgi:hypothetical protein